MKHEMLIAEWLSTPWALQRERLAAYAGIVAGWAQGKSQRYVMEDDDVPGERITAFEARRAQAQARVGSGSIAVIPVYGPIVQRAGIMTEWCGGSSTQQISGALRDALADDSVAQVLLDIDSPGGSVYGVSELFDEIIAARAKKPVIGIANSLAASAAYWLGAACSELYCTPGGEVGSIGVWMAHEDWSKAMEEAGIKTTLISAGKYKTEGNPYQPLDADAQAFMQSRIDDYYAAFTKAVAKGRGVGIESVRSGMGQGRVLGAAQAQTEKMIDGVMTFDDVVRQMQRNAKSGAAPKSRRASAERDLELMNLG